jgi:hypothetical protein
MKKRISAAKWLESHSTERTPPKKGKKISASRWLRHRVSIPGKNDKDLLTWPLEPFPAEYDTSHLLIWESACGRYRVIRNIHKYGLGNDFAVLRKKVTMLPRLDKGGVVIEGTPIQSVTWTNLDKRTSKVDRFSTLEKAIIACEQHAGRDSANRISVVRDATAHGIADFKEPQEPLISGENSPKIPRSSISIPQKEDRSMRLAKQTAVGLLEEAGFPKAKKYSVEKLTEELKAVLELQEPPEFEDDELSGIFDDLAKAFGKGKEITVVDDTAEEEPEEDKKKKTKKNSADAPSSKEGKKGRKSSGGGVIATIIEILKTTTAKKPLSKDEIVQRLVKKFPDREEKSMASTVMIQCGGRLQKEGKLEVKKNEKGYYV